MALPLPRYPPLPLVRFGMPVLARVAALRSVYVDRRHIRFQLDSARKAV
jgi:hypothetical protein